MDADIERLLSKIEQTRSQRTANPNVLAESNLLHDLTDNTVTKSHALSRAYYRFGLVEKRCMEALISKLNPLRTDNPQEIELHASEYLKAFPDVGNHAYEHLERAGDSLVNRVITVDSPRIGVARDKIPLMLIVSYQPKLGKITCEFNPKIIPHLLGLKKKFSSYPLRNAVSFSSSYTWRFYEVLASWVDKRKSNGLFIGWIDRQDIGELREMLGVPDSYRWINFQKQVLDVVEKELREKANIFIHFERIKTGRKITHLNIKFIENDQQQLPLGGAGS
ncbi:MAG: replication initiation protein [Vibrio gallaecicus]|jgi:plasmid replication initiation protein